MSLRSLWFLPSAALLTVTGTIIFAANLQTCAAKVDPKQPFLQGGTSEEIGISKAQFWIRSMGRDVFPPLLGDLDGDGHADVFRVIPSKRGQKTQVTVARTSALGKPRILANASTEFGPRPLAFACGPFTNRNGRAQVAAVMNNGALQIAYGFLESKPKPDATGMEAAPPEPTGARKRPGQRKRAARERAAGVAPPTKTDPDPVGNDEPDEEDMEDAATGSDLLTRITIATMIPEALRPAQPVRALLSGDFNGDDRTDLLVVDANGRLLLLRNDTSLSDKGAPSASPRFTPQSVAGSLAGVQRIAVGTFRNDSADRRFRIVYLDTRGKLLRAVLQFDKANAAALSPAVAVLQEGETLSPTEALAIGHFSTSYTSAAEASDDILIGKRLLVGGDRARTIVLPSAPSASDRKDDVERTVAAVGDVDGNGYDDLLRVRRVEGCLKIRERVVGDDGFVHFFYNPRRTDDLAWNFISSANDGLPDGWKMGRVKPYGYDLTALGCRVGRQDLIIEVQRVSDVPEEKVRALTSEAVAYYASLPTLNPDGSHGISMHIIFREPIPTEESEQTTRRYPPAVRKKARAALTERYHRANSQGIVHWMRIKMDSGGVAGVMGVVGHASPNAHVFLHELGHQLGLGHNGGWPAEFSPVYASIMSYHFLPQYSGGTSHYSTGQMRNIVLRETSLSEHLPTAPANVSYLAARPYNFTVRPAEDGASVWVDWNRNGRFDTGAVRADINLDKKITDDPMGDFDDIAVISQFGLSRSLRFIGE